MGMGASSTRLSAAVSLSLSDNLALVNVLGRHTAAVVVAIIGSLSISIIVVVRVNRARRRGHLVPANILVTSWRGVLWATVEDVTAGAATGRGIAIFTFTITLAVAYDDSTFELAV